MQNQFRRGDIYYIANERYRAGSEIRKDRPAIIVSNDVNNRFGNVVEVVFLTTSPKKNIPTHVTIRSTGRKSIACVSSRQQLRMREFRIGWERQQSRRWTKSTSR